MHVYKYNSHQISGSAQLLKYAYCMVVADAWVIVCDNHDQYKLPCDPCSLWFEEVIRLLCNKVVRTGSVGEALYPFLFYGGKL